MGKPIDSFLPGSFDAGHWGPGFGWLIYSTLVLWESFRLTYVLRRRYIEPLFAIVGGALIAGIHVIVIQKCYSLTADPNKSWNQERCFSVNGVHLGIGIYALIIGIYDGIQHLPLWQQRIGTRAPADKHQYHFLPPSLFLIVGLVMMSHEQDSMWQTMGHQYTAYLSLLFFGLRACSYHNRAFSAAAGLSGIVGSVVLANVSENGYAYWMQVDGGTNMFGIPISVQFLTLIVSACTLFGGILTMLAITLWSRLVPADNVCSRLSLPARFWLFFDRLDLSDEENAHIASAPSSSSAAYDIIDTENKSSALLLSESIEEDSNIFVEQAETEEET